MAIVDGNIRCPMCGVFKPLDAFAPSLVRRGNGRCRDCERQRSARYQHENREAVRETARRWYRANKKKHAERTARVYRRNPEASFDRHLRRKYGITLNDYNAILAAQGGGCALCGKKQSTEKLRLAVDHDHETGNVRGILCHHCNRAIGALGDSVDGIQRALDYLKRSERCNDEAA